MSETTEDASRRPRAGEAWLYKGRIVIILWPAALTAGGILRCLVRNPDATEQFVDEDDLAENTQMEMF